MIKKNKEVILYLFFGGLAFILSIVSYAFLNVTLGINELIANVISWIIVVLFAFFTNRIWVFSSPTKTVVDFLKQLISFFGGRVLTLVIEEIILGVFITWLQFPSMIIKIIAQIVVIVLNYVISKFLVFKND
ncbi:MAG: GtrA family protein [Agathobacter sp.]|nr:GtrA family protein [Agathobacter sp.]